MAMWPHPVDWAIEYAKLRALWRRSPVLYAKQRLGLNPTWQQAQLLKAIAEPEARVSVRSGHSTASRPPWPPRYGGSLNASISPKSRAQHRPLCSSGTSYGPRLPNGIERASVLRKLRECHRLIGCRPCSRLPRIKSSPAVRQKSGSQWRVPAGRKPPTPYRAFMLLTSASGGRCTRFAEFQLADGRESDP